MLETKLKDGYYFVKRNEIVSPTWEPASYVSHYDYFFVCGDDRPHRIVAAIGDRIETPLESGNYWVEMACESPCVLRRKMYYSSHTRLFGFGNALYKKFEIRVIEKAE